MFLRDNYFFSESKRFKHRQEVPDEVSPINPKKVFAHKKNKNKNYADQDQFEEHHSKLLGKAFCCLGQWFSS
jgi:hypothetical protein